MWLRMHWKIKVREFPPAHFNVLKDVSLIMSSLLEIRQVTYYSHVQFLVFLRRCHCLASSFLAGVLEQVMKDEGMIKVF